jgi:hypothetical protein
VVAVAAVVVYYVGFGSTPIDGQQTSFTVRDDHSLSMTIEVQRDDPHRTAECVVRARSQTGSEVGRKEVLIPPSNGTVSEGTVLRTTTRAVTGEVFGCTYDGPAYLSHPMGPTG